MNQLETIRWLWAFQDWTRPRLLEAAARCPALTQAGVIAGMEQGGSVFAAIAHIVGAEEVWARRWAGSSPAKLPNAHDFRDLADLAGKWEEAAALREGYLQRLTEADLAGDLVYTRVRDNVDQRMPLWSTLLHVANHSTHHRAEAAVGLTALGAPPQSLDMLDFIREQSI